jgi:hypothetical protein
MRHTSQQSLIGIGLTYRAMIYQFILL